MLQHNEAQSTTNIQLFDFKEPKGNQVFRMKDYKAIFEKVESTLISVGSANVPADRIRAELDQYKHLEGKPFSDADYYWVLVSVVFYSGFRAATVTDKLESIRKHFPDYETVADYDESKVAEILGNADMIRNKRKVRACIDNARIFKSIVSEHGSLQAYIDSFAPKESFENLVLLKEELEYRFRGLGRVTVYHFLTDIGLPVLKPDRVICRVFERLGLVESDEQLWKAVIQGRRFAQEVAKPIRYIDAVFVSCGQVKSKELGLASGICLEKRPLCSVCGVTEYCNYFARDAAHSDVQTGERR
jgi:DNA-3-methyladenine glycosylase I